MRTAVGMVVMSLLLLSCSLEIPDEGYSERWFAITNLDGSGLQYVCKANGAPYFVPDPDNPEEETILFDTGSSIKMVCPDGSNERTIVDSVATVSRFSSDRTRMLLNHEGEIYLCNTDGTGLQNLTQTPEIWERDPSFSADDSKIVYSYTLNDGSDGYLAIRDLNTGVDSVVYHRSIGRNVRMFHFNNPHLTDANTIVYLFYIMDQVSDPYVYVSELHEYDINGSEDRTLIDAYHVYNHYFTASSSLALIQTDGRLQLIDTENLSTLRTFDNILQSGRFPLSASAQKIALDHVTADFSADLQYVTPTSVCDVNRSETKVVGIVTRSFTDQRRTGTR